MEKLNDIRTVTEKIMKDYPTLIGPFLSFVQAAEKEGTLSAKTKSLMSIALSLGKQCEWCIPHHVRRALELGATEEEIMETSVVAIYMTGAPAYSNLILLFKSIEEFTK